jgi:hypothetical protein
MFSSRTGLGAGFDCFEAYGVSKDLNLTAQFLHQVGVADRERGNCLFLRPFKMSLFNHKVTSSGEAGMNCDRKLVECRQHGS